MTDDQIRAAGGPNDDTVSVDLNAVRHDDEFLDALIVGSALPLSDAAERELGGLLFAWRTESLAAPAPVQPTLADVEKAIAAQETAAKRRAATRHLRLISGAAAITAVAAAGLLVLSENSQPGDPLWNVKKVVFAEEAKQTQATVDVQNNLSAPKRRWRPATRARPSSWSIAPSVTCVRSATRRPANACSSGSSGCATTTASRTIRCPPPGVRTRRRCRPMSPATPKRRRR